MFLGLKGVICYTSLYSQLDEMLLPVLPALLGLSCSKKKPYDVEGAKDDIIGDPLFQDLRLS